MVRKPAVAGRFYPGDRARLDAEVRSYFDEGASRVRSIGVVSPHAGYVYSGQVAGRVFSRVEIPGRVVVMGPNHRGVGERAAVMSEGAWETPLGEVSLDVGLAQKLSANSSATAAFNWSLAISASSSVLLGSMAAANWKLLVASTCSPRALLATPIPT